MTSTDLTNPTANLPGPLVERMARQARGSRAESTWRMYQTVWRIWQEWAAAHGVSSLPASPVDVAAFLSDKSADHKYGTLRKYVAGISVVHSMKNQPFQASAPAIKTQLKGIARDIGTDQRKVRPLMAKKALDMLRDAGASLVDVRDMALLSLGIAMAARRSEIAGLHWLSPGPHATGVLELNEDGAVVRLLRSKTSQTQAVEVHIQPGPALKAVRTWVERAGIAAGSPLFRAVTRRGHVSPDRICDRTVARIVKRRVDAAGLEPEHYSGHSLRAGMITSAAVAGIAEWRIRLTSRHSAKSQELAGYIRDVERKVQALTNDIGL
jgi:integrase